MKDMIQDNSRPKYASWISTIAEGTASYCSHERIYTSDVRATFEAYANALKAARKWLAEFRGEHTHSARVYMTMYLKPAMAAHVALKAGVNEFKFKQRIRVFVREVDSVDECSPDHLSLWKLREKRSKVRETGSSDESKNILGQIPLTVYKIVSADGINWRDTFESLLKKLDEIKKVNYVHDPAASPEGEVVSLLNSCDSFDLLRGNENHIEAGVIMTVPYMYEFEKPHQVDVHEIPDFNFL